MTAENGIGEFFEQTEEYQNADLSMREGSMP